MKQLVMCLAFAGIISGAPLEGSISTTFTISPSTSCSIALASVPVYEGGSEDPLCRNYLPELGIADGPILNSGQADLSWIEAVDDDGAHIFTGVLSTEIFYYMQGLLRSYDPTGVGPLYQTRLKIEFDHSIPIRATLPGSGYGRFTGAIEQPPSVGMLWTPDISVEYPVFALGQESVVAVINYSLSRRYLDENWWGVYNGQSQLLRWAAAEPVPEPSTALLALPAIGWMIWLRKRRAATA